MNAGARLYVVCLYIFRSVLEGVITQFLYLTLTRIMLLILGTLLVELDHSKAFVKLPGRIVL